MKINRELINFVLLLTFTFGLFFTAFLAFSRFFPVINMAEVKSILKHTGEKVKIK